MINMLGDVQPKLDQQIIGPQITLNTELCAYQKPNFDSQASLRSIETPHIQTNRYLFNKRKFQKLTRIINIPQNTQTKIDQEERIQSDDLQAFPKLVKKNRLIQKFKTNLFQNSYVLPLSYKQKILEQEQYIQPENTAISQSNEMKYQDRGYLKQNKSAIFLPQSLFLYFWDLITLMANLLALWVCPFLLSFSYDDYSFPKIILGLIIHSIIDNLLVLNRALIYYGEVIEERKQIISQYINKQFIIETLSLCLWIGIYPNVLQEFGQTKQVLLIIQNILVLIKLSKINNRIENIYLRPSLTTSVDLLTLMLSIYFFAHVMACLFHFIGIISDINNQMTWLIKREIRFEDVWIRYNTSFYWSTMTLTTVGYGDITPENQGEMIFVNMMMFLSSLLFAYSVNSIGMILRNIYEKNRNFKHSILQLNNYMKHNQVDECLQIRIRNYLKHKMQSINQESLILINKTISELPKGLKFELNQNISEKIIRSINMLQGQFSKTTLQLLSQKLSFLVFQPQEFIFHQYEIDDQSLYFVKEGSIDICEEQSNQVIQTITKGQTFGEYQFFTGFPTKTCAISKTQSEVIQIQRGNFFKILQEEKKDLEKFNNIKDRILLYHSYSILQLNCNICNRHNHLNIDCPLLTFQPDLEKVIKSENIQKLNQRRSIILRKGYKINTRRMLGTIQESLNKYQQEVQTTSERDNSNCISPDLNSRINFRKKSLKKHFQYVSISNTLNSDKEITSDKLIQFQITKDGFEKKKTTVSKIQIGQEEIYTEKERTMLSDIERKFQFHNVNIDKIKQYSEYMIHNNFHNVMKQLEGSNQKIIKQNFDKQKKYTFNFLAQFQALKLRNNFEPIKKKK